MQITATPFLHPVAHTGADSLKSVARVGLPTALAPTRASRIRFETPVGATDARWRALYVGASRHFEPPERRRQRDVRRVYTQPATVGNSLQLSFASSYPVSRLIDQDRPTVLP